MDIIRCYTQQGVAVTDLRATGVVSGGFDSCSPIVMYSSTTHAGGLYHLGGKLGDLNLLLASPDWGYVQQMIQQIAPTEVHVFPSGFASPSRIADTFAGTGTSGVPLTEAEEAELEELSSGWHARTIQMRADRACYGDRNNLRVQFEASFQNSQPPVQVVVSEAGRTQLCVVAGNGGGVQLTDSPPQGSREINLATLQGQPPPGCTIYNRYINYGLWT